jgi:alkylhydroperoxidase/carboxymuconolactone decarboxylase family protein YurZ
MANQGSPSDATEAAINLTLGSALDTVREADPLYYQRFLSLARVPYARGALPPATRELVQIALHGSITQLNDETMKRHVTAALEIGVSPAQIAEALQLAAVLGIHAGQMGFHILVDEARQAGKLEPVLSKEEEEVFKAKFIEARGFWHPDWDPMLLLSPGFMEAYMGYSAHAWRTGTLEPKVKEFIYIAIDVSVTHMHEPGTRQHIRNAFKNGATVNEIVEVMELASLVGIHSFARGMGAVAEARKTKA